MVIVAFPPGEKYAVNYTTLDQYDYGQILRIQGLKLPKTVEVHFSTQETGGTSITRVGVTKDGVTDVLIPDSVLENGDTTQNYSIFVFVYITDATSGKTEYRARLEVKARPKPEIPGGEDNPDIFHEAVLAVRESAEKAEEAQKQAEGWAHGGEDLPERAEDNAMYYAGKTSEDAKKTAQDRAEVERLTESNTQIQGEVAKDLEEVKKFSSQAQASATNAALSEQKSEEAATRAEIAQTGAETAENNAELAAQKTGQDKAAVEQARDLVQQMGQEVLDNKNAVDKTVQDFNLTAQQALADVNNVGQTQTERVQTAGTTAVENIENTQGTATQAVETAKSEAIKAVQTEGTTQTGNVTAEGEKQVQAVQTAAQEIISDREQIAKNKADIAEINVLNKQLQDALISQKFSGSNIKVTNSAKLPIVKLSVFGKSEQITTTGANLFNALTITEKHWLNTENGNIEPASTFWTSDFIEVGEGDYCLTEKGTNRNCGYDEGKNFVKPLLASKGKITVTSGIKFIRVSGVYETIKPNNFMINRGSTTKPYEPYTGGEPSPSIEYLQEITSCGENGNVKIDVTGKNLFDIHKDILDEDGVNKKYLFRLKPNTEYTLSTNAPEFTTTASLYFNGGSSFANGVCKNKPRTIRTDELGGFYIIVRTTISEEGFNLYQDVIDEKYWIQLEEGSSATAYEPYKEQTLTISTPNGLLGLKVDVNGNYTDETGQQWITDEIDLARGKYVQRIGERIFDGTEAWGKYKENQYSFPKWADKKDEMIAYTENKYYLCNIARIKNKDSVAIGEFSTHLINQGNGWILFGFAGTLEEWKRYLATKKAEGNPVTVQYILAEPVEYNLPPETIAAFKKLHTNYPTTLVSNNADAGMELTYTVDTQSYIDGKITEVSTAIVQKGI